MIAIAPSWGTLAGVALVLVLGPISLTVGVSDVSLASAWHDPQAREVLFASRLPRTIAAILAGAGLAIAGLVMQTLSRNRFVEPATAGTTQSAALGILVVTLLWPSASVAVKSLGASAAALGGTSIFLAIAHRLPPAQPYLVPLVGLIYGGVLGACLTFIAWQTDLLQYLEAWTVGEFSGVLRGRYELLWAAAAMVALIWWTADRLTVLSLGRDVSIGLGLDYQQVLRIGLLAVSVISALTVVVVGTIPFVGLVVPNLVSRFKGDNVSLALPTVAASGAALVLLCDILGRLVRYPYEIPVGTVLGVVGAAAFLILLVWRGPHG